MKAKPIEPGCLAIILPDPKQILPELDFQECYVFRFQGELPEEGRHFSDEADFWEVGIGLDGYYIRRQFLMRVDDPDIKKQIESEKPVEVEHGN